MNWKVIVYFDFPFATDFFTLDDPTRGLLDGTTYTLYSASPVDVTADVNSVTINRGNTSQLFPDVSAGTGVIQLNNDAGSTLGPRTYDPLNSSSPYYGNIIPGRRVTVSSDDQIIFDGRVAAWDYTYDVSGRSVAVMKIADGLSILGRQEFDDWTATAGQTAGPRISNVLDRAEVQWPYSRDLDTGVSVLQGDTVTFQTNVLAYLNTVAKSDLGLLFIARDGVLTFRDRHAALNAATTVSFADDGTGIPYTTIGTSYGDDLLYNRISVSATGFGPATVLELTSQFEYGIRSYSTPTLLLNSSAQMLDMANFIAGTYANPEYRITKIVVELTPLSAASRIALATLDIASVVAVSFTPNRTGTAITRNSLVIGMSHDIGPARHTLTLSLSDVDRRSFFQLDDTVFGKLDTSLLAF